MSPPRNSLYTLYGLTIQSEVPLRSVAPGGGIPKIRIRRGEIDWGIAPEASIKSPDKRGWFSYCELHDGTLYLRWRNLCDFAVSSDGCLITVWSRRAASPESIESYLISQVLSCALIRLGMEPIHATVLMTSLGAVGFLGDSGFGKSTLAATFVADGDQLVTDDLMLTGMTVSGRVVYPGSQRLKLYAADARRILGAEADGRINDLTEKRIVRLGSNQVVSAPVRLVGLYALLAPARGSRRKRITIRQLDRTRAFIELTKGAFNSIILGDQRLQVQFDAVAGLASDVPVSSLSYPSGYAILHDVRGSVLENLAHR